MSTIELGSGVRLEGASGIMLAPPGRRGRRSARLDEPLLDAPIDAALADAGYTVVADAELAPAPSAGPDSPRDSSLRRTREARPAPAELVVPVAPDQSAVLLVESAGGVFSWRQPVEDERRSRDAGELRFALRDPSIAPASGRRSLGLGWLGDRLLEPIRVRVLTFVAGIAIDRLVDRFEGDLKGGLVAIDGEPATWTADRAPTLPTGARPRILLLVHGTFSTTLGSYAALGATDAGKAFLAQARGHYDAILGYDHKTLAADPLENARDIAHALAGLPAGTHVDAIAYSRGALVYRALRETVRPANLDFGRVVFVGAANSGTMLANPENWHALVDLYTSIAVAAVRAIGVATSFPAAAVVAQAIRTIGRFVQALPDLAIHGGRVPGLAAMEPDGAFVAALNRQTVDIADYRVIASDFQPRFDPGKGLTGELVEFLVNRLGDRLLAQANDLVVHTASMTDFGKSGVAHPSDTLALAPEGLVYHLVYFSADAAVNALGHWLLGIGDAPAPAIATTRRARADDGPAPAPVTVTVTVPAPSATVVIADSWSVDSPAAARPGRRNRMRASAGPTALAPPTPVAAAPPPAAAPTASLSCWFAANMDASPPAMTPVPLSVVISPNRIVVTAGPTSVATDAGVTVDAGKAIEIRVIPLSNCRLLDESDDGGVEKVTPPTDRARTVWFVVESFGPGLGRIQVEARQDGALLALLLLEPVFVPAEAGLLSVSQLVTARPRDGVDPTTLTIHEVERQDGSLEIRYTLDSRDPRLAGYERTLLPSLERTVAFAAEYIRKLDDAYGLGSQQYALAHGNLLDFAARSADEIIPLAIRQALWDARGKIRAIQVVADSPHIPWELLAIADPTGRSDEETRFLCEWGLVRRLPGAFLPDPVLPLRADRVRYVIPDYLDSRDALAFAPAERRMLLDHFRDARPVDADSDAVKRFLRTEAADCDLLHLCCHGETQQQATLASSLVLRGRAEASGIVAEDLLAHYSVSQAARFSDSGPNGLVFINACQTGRSGTQLSGGAAGFPDAFLRPKSHQGAAAVVAALWSVDDKGALRFAATFYDRLLAGDTFVAAGKAARAACKPDPANPTAANDFTWLAYSFYGNPFATVAP